MVVAFISLMPSSGHGSFWDIPHFDKIAHFGIYALISFLMLIFYWNGSHDRKSVSYTLGFSISYGILLEILQNSRFSQRDFDIFDICANIIGAFAGVAFFKLLKK